MPPQRPPPPASPNGRAADGRVCHNLDSEVSGWARSILIASGGAGRVFPSRD